MLPSDTQKYPSVEEARSLVAELCRHFYKQGWVSGTGGGISLRAEGGRVVMAPSGVQKERMQPHDMFILSADGDVLQPPAPCSRTGRPAKLSECAPLFQAAYSLRGAGAVLHSHALEAMLVTLLDEGATEFRCTQLEMLKGIAGHGFYDTLVVPIIENTARESELTAAMREAIVAFPSTSAVLVKAHGVYVWGATWAQAKTQAECYHYLFSAAIEARKLGLRIDCPPALPAPRTWSNGAPRWTPAAQLEALAAPDDAASSALEAWVMQEQPDGPPSAEQRCSPNVPVSALQLAQLGVLSWRLPPGTAESQARLDAIKKIRGYSFEDTVSLSRATLGDGYDAKMAIFYSEHIHSDEEVRYVLSGGGYFDVRCERAVGEAAKGAWVRVHTKEGDLVVLPAGAYHRFVLDAGESIVANRLFIGEPVWTPINRGEEADGHAARLAYVKGQAAI